MRNRIIIACFLRAGAFAAIAADPLEQWRLGRGERQLEGEPVRGDAGRPLSVRRPPHPPIAQSDIGIAGTCLCQTKPATRRSFAVQQAAGRGIGQGRMREQDLPRGKSTGVTLVDHRPRTKESHLEPQLLACGRVQPAGHVPPLRPKRRVRAVVARKPHREPWSDDRIGRCCGDAPMRAPPMRPRGAKRPSPVLPHRLHCGFRRSHAGRPPPRSRPPHRSAPLPRRSACRRVCGVSIVQLNDCGLITWISTCARMRPRPIPASPPVSPTIAPSVATIAVSCRRVRPRWRSIPNSRSRAIVCADIVAATPASPTRIATASSR